MVATQRGVADKRTDIHRRTCLSHRFGVGINCGVDKMPGLAQQVHRIGNLTFHPCRRRANAAVTDDHGCYPLADFRQVLRHTDNVDVIVGMNINKSRR